MFTGFAHAQMMSILWPVVGVAPNVLASTTANTYSADPQPAAGIDTWQAGGALFTNLLILVNATVATAGTLVVSLYDSKDPITAANGDASTKKVADLATVSAAGFYYAELQFSHVFGDTLARVVADPDNIAVRRYHSIRAVSAGGTFTFSVMCIYGFSSRDYPVQVADELAITWVAA
jgi:hypothetical protein